MLTFRLDRLFLALAVGFGLLLTSSGLTLWLWYQQDNATFWVQHALQVENQLNHILALGTQAETGQRGYLLTGRSEYLDPYSIAKQQLLGEIDKLQALTADNPAQRQRVADVRSTASAKLIELENVIRLRMAGQVSEAATAIEAGRGRTIMDDFRAAIEAMRTEEEALLQSRYASQSRIADIARITSVIGGILGISLALLSFIHASKRAAELQASHDRLRDAAKEREAVEEQVRQLQKMEAIGQLTGGIAHDFNNMLAVIIGSLDLVLRRVPETEPPKVRKHIANAREAANRASLLTARLLAFSRQQALSPQAIDPNKLVAGISEMLRRTLGEMVEIETVLGGGIWLINADKTQLESSIVNLALNARDAMPEGGRLTIETANADLDERYAKAHVEVVSGQYVMISITDTGHGMSKEVMQHAFDPFFTTKGPGKGTGLGLSQVFGFVKQSQGHIKIYSEVGHGTTIKIYLPRHMGSGETAQGATSISRLPRAKPSETILVVEDEEQVRNVTVDALEELGYRVVTAASPDEALKLLERDSDVSLLFTDVVMPGMSGRVLADKIQAMMPNLPVLYTTGYTRNAIVHNGILDAGTAYLAKPFTIDQLAAKIRDILDR
ncbi:MAG TPA: CHASE3 domain-containing protein [Terriglobia bacterium]|nr:CHASE3 domain-containing protein [Terriglobia bacterium]